jgi:UDP-glucuronate 4-epimerase
MKILLTGHAGFIGSHLLERLLSKKHTVVAVDNYDPFYDRAIKQANLQVSREQAATGQLTELNFDLSDPGAYREILSTQVSAQKSHFDIETSGFDAIIHLAAKAGVRPSIADPVGYQRANVIATQNLLEFARAQHIRQFVFAGSSSVYGINPHVPWCEEDAVLRPISPYASTKVSGELLGHVYSHLYDIRFLSLRFFTVYGPRQRPDLAIHKFTRMILDEQPIPVFGDGSTRRDYTYVADVVDGIEAALHYQKSPYEIINLGNDQTVTLTEMIKTIEAVLGKKAIIDRQSDQPGDVPQTWANIAKANQLLGYKPGTPFCEGIRKFVDWMQAAS